MSIRLFFSIFLSMIALNVAAQGRELPDFTDLVDKHGSAVVNVSTTQTVRGNRTLPQFPELDEDDPMFEFFKRFIPRQPGMPRDFQSKSLGSGFIISPDGYILTNAHVPVLRQCADVGRRHHRSTGHADDAGPGPLRRAECADTADAVRRVPDVSPDSTGTFPRRRTHSVEETDA